MKTSDIDHDKYDVTLFSSNSPEFCLVTACIDEDNKLSICSGGEDEENYILVDESQFGSLKKVLEKAANPRTMIGSPRAKPSAKIVDDNADILQDLFKLFSKKDDNPFDDIKAFLDMHKVNWKPDHWSSQK